MVEERRNWRGMKTCFSPTFRLVYTNMPVCWCWMMCACERELGRTKLPSQHLEQRKCSWCPNLLFGTEILVAKPNHLYLEVCESPDKFALIVDNLILLTTTIIKYNKSTENTNNSSRQKEVLNRQLMKSTRSQNQEHGLGSSISSPSLVPPDYGLDI